MVSKGKHNCDEPTDSSVKGETMSGPTLSAAQNDINRIIDTARGHAKRSLDDKATAMLLQVILSVSQAVNPDTEDHRALIVDFVNRMQDTTSWLRGMRAYTPAMLGSTLAELWLSYIYQLPHPDNVYLVSSAQRANELAEKKDDTYIIVTTDFSDAVKDTVNDTIRDNPDKTLDPNSTGRYPLHTEFEAAC